jgi:uncharacterized protein
MEKNQILTEAEEFITELFRKESSGHDAEHSFRVYRTAMKIAGEEPKADAFLVALASLLHDVDDRKLFPKNTHNENARAFLEKEGLGKDVQEKILRIIAQVSFKGNETEVPDTLEGMIVQDADRLDAIGAIGIARAFAYGGAHGRKLYDPKEKPNPDQTYEQYKNTQSSTIAHFYEKLLLLEGLMNTKEAKKIAQERTAYMKGFLAEFQKEVEEDS